MAIANRARVDDGLAVLREAIVPIGRRHWSDRYGPQWRVTVNGQLERPFSEPSTDDPAFLLKGMIATWDEIWSAVPGLGTDELRWVWEIDQFRGRVARFENFSLDDADRATETIERLLRSLDAVAALQKVERHREALRRQRFKKLIGKEATRGNGSPGAVTKPAIATTSASVGGEASIRDPEVIEACWEELKQGLALRCRRRWSKQYGKSWRDTVNQRVDNPSDSIPTDGIAFLLGGVIATWDDVWSLKHGRHVRGWVEEAYSTFLHSYRTISFYDAQRTLDTIERILGAFGAIVQKKRVREHRDSLLRELYKLMRDGDGAVAEPPVTESVSEEVFGSPGADTETGAEVGDSAFEEGTTSAPPEQDGPAGRESGIASGAPAGEGDSFGSLGAALLSAGFGADGSLPEVRPEPASAAPAAAEPEPAVSRAAEPARQAASRRTEAPVPDPADVLIEEEEPVSPYEKPGSWYVIHAYSGHEKKVKANLSKRTESLHMQDRVFEVVIPTEKVVEIRQGRKKEVDKRMFPGYLLIRMYLDDDSWRAVRDTPGVTAFVGMGSGVRPTPLSRREVERFLGLRKEAAKKAPRFKPAWEIGETVRVASGPFADFNGVVEDINVDQQKVTVLVEIFGRDTPMELGFEDIQKQ